MCPSGSWTQLAELTRYNARTQATSVTFKRRKRDGSWRRQQTPTNPCANCCHGAFHHAYCTQHTVALVDLTKDLTLLAASLFQEVDHLLQLRNSVRVFLHSGHYLACPFANCCLLCRCGSLGPLDHMLLPAEDSQLHLFYCRRYALRIGALQGSDRALESGLHGF